MRYLIIGNGVAGITAAFTLRRRDPQARITVVSSESDYFFSRTALMYAFMDRLNLRDLEPFERSAYDQAAIDRVRGRVVDIDAGRRIVRLDDGRELGFDRLLLSLGSSPHRIEWPGLAAVREGATHFVSLQDLAECERLTPSTRRAVVTGGGLIGVELAECLLHHRREVDLLVREPWYWPAALTEEEGSLVAGHLTAHGVRLHFGQEVAFVDAGPDGRLQSVTTSGGLQLPCQLLGICIGVRPAVNWLRSAATPPASARGILVDQSFRTSLPGVFAAGDCAEFAFPEAAPLVETSWYAAKRHGELAARAMLGDPVAYAPPLFFNSAKFFHLEYTAVGDVGRHPSRASGFFYRLPGHTASLRIVQHGGAVTGFSMLGARWDHSRFEQWIAARLPIGEAVRLLPSAQFDVEFGRASLEGLDHAFAAWQKSTLLTPA